MKRVPYMRDPHSPRVWLDRCPDCRGIWFDANELEQTSGRDLHLVIGAAEHPAPCPRCALPLHHATVLKAPAFACAKCRGLHLPLLSLNQLDVSLEGEEPTLRPPPLFECIKCKRTLSIDQGDGITCSTCAPATAAGRAGDDEVTGVGDLSTRYGLSGLLDFLFTR